MRISTFVSRTDTQNATITDTTVDDLAHEGQARDANTPKSDLPPIVYGETDGQGRGNNHTLTRTAVVLDIDHCGDYDPRDTVRGLGYEALIHETASSQPGDRGWRIVIPLSEPITNAQTLKATTEYVAGQINPPQWDRTCAEWARFFYAPACNDGRVCVALNGTPISPVHDNPGHATTPAGTTKRDPRELPGVMGAWCRAHDIQSTIDTLGLP